MHIYFSGIGGAGLSPLSQLALDAGFEVSGSDAMESILSEAVRKRGISVTIGQSYQEIQGAHTQNHIDWIVVTSALKEDHPHYIFAHDNGIKISKRHELINLIISEKKLKLLAVAGTHGKTTTTAMIVWLFKQLATPLSYLIGSNISFGPSSQYQSGSTYFVLETDEFDRNFLNFHPEISLITSFDYDHPDTYPTQDSYNQAFQQFLNQSKTVVSFKAILQKITSESTVFHPKIITPDFTEFENGCLANIVGIHNRQNATLASNTAGYVLENHILTQDQLTPYFQKISSFPGTQRRFEKIAQNLYSDYAHHPTEIAATLELATEVQQKLGLGQIIVVYQPHQNIRQHEVSVQLGYAHCFDQADKVYWLPTYLSRENPDLEILTPQFLSSFVSSATQVKLSDLQDSLANSIKKHFHNNDLIVLFGAGSIDEWGRNLSIKLLN